MTEGEKTLRLTLHVIFSQPINLLLKTLELQKNTAVKKLCIQLCMLKQRSSKSTKEFNTSKI